MTVTVVAAALSLARRLVAARLYHRHTWTPSPEVDPTCARASSIFRGLFGLVLDRFTSTRVVARRVEALGAVSAHFPEEHELELNVDAQGFGL